MTDLLQVRDLKVDYRLEQGIVGAVKGVSFRVGRASTVALVGESGSGKSTIAQAIMGILPNIGTISGGQILFMDPRRIEIAQLPERRSGITDLAGLALDGGAYQRIRGGRISMIFQEPMTSLSPLHTVGDQIGEAAMLHSGLDKDGCLDAVIAMLRVVGFADPVKAVKTYPFELSGGLRQRAMIAMALVGQPVLLVADEPTTALDVTIQAQILKLISDLQSTFEMAVLVITHDLGVVANLADEVVVLYDGKVVEAGTLDDIFRNPGHPYLQSLLRAVPHQHMKPGERLVPIHSIERTQGGYFTAGAEGAGWDEVSSADEIEGPLLSVSHISKSYSIRKGGFFGVGEGAKVRAVDDVSLDIAQGETLGLVGESGCGKTTLNKIIMRAMAPDGGQVLFRDAGRMVDLTKLSGNALIPYRRKYQYVFQDPFASLNPRMTVFDIIGEPLLIHRVGDAAERTEMVKELMGMVGLDPRFLNRYPHSFSGGQRQRISIARALALKPSLLLLDEPVSALDVSVQAQILNLMKDLQDELGLTYLFVSHNLAVVDYVADRIAVMCAGRLVEMAPRDALFDHPRHPYTQALLAAVPVPDPGRRLDLGALMDGRASDPAEWPEPYGLGEDAPAHMSEVAEGHFVRVVADA